MKKRNVINELFAIMFVAVLSLLLSGCTPNYGYYSVNQDTLNALEEGRAVQGYDYFFSGSAAEPEGILAIKKGVAFDQGLWRSAPSSDEQISRWARQIQNEYRLKSRYFGYDIYNPEGEKIGMWWAIDEKPTVLFNKQSGKITVITPRALGSRERQR